MNKPIVPDKIVLIEGSEPAIPIHGSAAADGVQRGENGLPLFRVEIARLVRETQVIVVEAPDQEYLEDHIHDVYDTYEENGVDELKKMIGLNQLTSKFIIGLAVANVVFLWGGMIWYWIHGFR